MLLALLICVIGTTDSRPQVYLQNPLCRQIGEVVMLSSQDLSAGRAWHASCSNKALTKHVVMAWLQAAQAIQDSDVLPRGTLCA